MFKKLNKKGFTLAELLIVVAIIGVLVAVSIPIFTSQLEKARYATNLANCRSAKAAAVSAVLSGDTEDGKAPVATTTYYVTLTCSSGATTKLSTTSATSGPSTVTGARKGTYETVVCAISGDGKTISFPGVTDDDPSKAITALGTATSSGTGTNTGTNPGTNP